ncbi:MAG: isochorismatase family protein [Phycisphaerae bacterium]|nr:isochorismatase family protein [Phycisphaerae bacterium]
MLLDVAMQADFFLPGGSMYTTEAMNVRAQMYRLFEWAMSNNHPVISTVLRVKPGQSGPLGRIPHCVEGSYGERKLPQTLIPPYIDLGMRNITDLPDDILQRYHQIIFEQRSTDVFDHARAERLLSQLPPTTFVVCGAGLSFGVSQAAIGLRNRGYGVVIPNNAVLDFGSKYTKNTCSRLAAKGVVFLSTKTITTAHEVSAGLLEFHTDRPQHKRRRRSRA